MRRLFIFSIIVSVLSCTVNKRDTPSAVGVVTLNNYALNPGVSLPDTVNYFFITKQNDFDRMFSATKMSMGKITVPNFTSQSVVAILFKTTEKVVSVNINGATISADKLNVNYTVTDTTSWKSYLQVPTVVATVPKSLDVKRVAFYRNNAQEKIIAAVY